MEAEQDRLRRLYAEMGDDHLLDMASEPEDLTTDARMAMNAELRRRGLQAHPRTPVHDDVDGKVSVPADDTNERAYAFGVGIPGVVPASGSAVETALEPGGEVRQGMSALVSLSDGHELTRACEALEATGIGFAIEEIAGDASTGTPTRYEIWVEPGQQGLGRAVLQEKLGLFPPAEVMGDGVALPADGDLVVGEFETAAEAQRVRAMLVEEGFAAKVEAEDAGAGVSVSVPAREQEEALEVLAARLGLG